MKKSTKILAACAAVAAMGSLGAYAFAQQGHGPGHGMGRGMGQGMEHGRMGGQGHGGMMGGKMGGMMGRMQGDAADPTARLDAIKTEIGIKPEQTTAWNVYAKVVADTAADQRAVRDNMDRDAVRGMQPAERQQHFTQMQAQRDAARNKVTKAAETLLSQLDESQKVIATRALPGLASAGGGMHHGMMGGQGMKEGMNQGMGPRFQR